MEVRHRRLVGLANSIDILHVPDAESFAYYRNLRQLANSLGLEHIVFECAGSLAGIFSKLDSLEGYTKQLRETRAILDGHSVDDLRDDENVSATSRYYDTALPKHQDPEGLKASMLKRGKVSSMPLIRLLLTFLGIRQTNCIDVRFYSFVDSRLE